MAAATVPFAGIWCALSLALGRVQQQRNPEDSDQATEKLKV